MHFKMKWKNEIIKMTVNFFRIKIANGAVVCSECELQGDIVIGARTVIHPRAKILALSGPIIIGENNIIEEQVQIVNK